VCVCVCVCVCVVTLWLQCVNDLLLQNLFHTANISTVQGHCAISLDFICLYIAVCHVPAVKLGLYCRANLLHLFILSHIHCGYVYLLITGL